MKKGLKLQMIVCTIGLIVLSITAAAYSAEKTLQVRTMEDPGVIVDDSICAEAPFTANVRLGAYVWTYETRASDGAVVNDMVRQIGTARACLLITDFRFTPFSVQHPFYIRFDLADGSYAGLGNCTISSNDIPVSRLILAGCTLRLTQYPSGMPAGSAVSSSVFNPFQLSGFSTGSYWALRLYSE